MNTKQNWFGEHRLAWIAETLHIFGFINRHHLTRKFGISAAQCANDFREFNKRFPQAMTYIPSEKRYVANDNDQGFILNTGPIWFDIDWARPEK